MPQALAVAAFQPHAGAAAQGYWARYTVAVRPWLVLAVGMVVAALLRRPVGATPDGVQGPCRPQQGQYVVKYTG